MAENQVKEALLNFKKTRIKDINAIREMYADDASERRRTNNPIITPSYSKLMTAAQVREALGKAFKDNSQVVAESKKLYATNPIYASIINYLANMFMWKYKVLPHKVYTESKAASRRKLTVKNFEHMYSQMLEVVDGVSFETTCPSLLTTLFIEGAVYFATLSDENTLTIDTIKLPNKYCRKVAETQFGTAVIEFDVSYFDSLGLKGDQQNEFLEGFPEEVQKAYWLWKKNNVLYPRWVQLDPRFATGILLNEYAIPTYLYLLAGIRDYEQYQDNELERNENKLKYLVVQEMPHYEDTLIFEEDEVKALHQSMKKIIEVNDKAKLVTTYGTVHIEKVSENDTTENEVLSKAFEAIFNNAGFNSSIFTSNSVEALKMALIRDKGMVWKYVQSIINFYNITINSWFDFKDYQADIDILPISAYTYNDDIERYKNNATLGVGKIDYIIASGIKQTNVRDTLELEKFLKLDEITPMQTSYTQTAEDRTEEKQEDSSTEKKSEDSKSEEPADKEQSDNKPTQDNED